jgi:hypothetical protein
MVKERTPDNKKRASPPHGIIHQQDIVMGSTFADASKNELDL